MLTNSLSQIKTNPYIDFWSDYHEIYDDNPYFSDILEQHGIHLDIVNKDGYLINIGYLDDNPVNDIYDE